MKSINISDELHKELKIYAIKHNTTVKKIAENAIGRLLSSKPATDKKSFVEVLEKITGTDKKGDMPFS